MAEIYTNIKQWPDRPPEVVISGTFTLAMLKPILWHLERLTQEYEAKRG